MIYLRTFWNTDVGSAVGSGVVFNYVARTSVSRTVVYWFLVVVSTGRLHSFWARMQEKWPGRRYGTMLCVAVEEDSVFDRPVWYGYMGTPKEEEVERLLKASLLAVYIGTMETLGVKEKHPRVF